MATNKPNITFDNLDKKCIQELPLMLDVISSTFNKIKTFLDYFYDDLHKLLVVEVKKRKGWHLSKNKKDHGFIYYPFTDDSYSNLTKIRHLNNAFWLEGYFYIYFGNYWPPKRAFNIAMGIVYTNSDDFEFKKPTTYFYVSNYDLNKFDYLHNSNFYTTLKKSLKLDSNMLCDFPVFSSDEEEESIWLYTELFDVDTIAKIYSTFKEKIVLSFIRNLE